jgi:hypothetical protein
VIVGPGAFPRHHANENRDTGADARRSALLVMLWLALWLGVLSFVLGVLP